MADKLLIVMVNSDLNNPTELGAPILQATVAAAMEYEVEVIFSGRAGELAKSGVTDNLYIQPGDAKSIYDQIHDAAEAGVVFKVCSPSVEIWGNDLIPEIKEIVGGAYIISEAMDDDTVTLTY